MNILEKDLNQQDNKECKKWILRKTGMKVTL